jgi:hypothetical protein
MRRVGGLFAVAAFLLVMTGCAENLSEDQKVQLRSATSPYQQEALADLRVSEQEYRAAVSEAHRCVAASGAVPDPVAQVDDSHLGFGFAVTAPDEAAGARITDKAHRCQSDYMDVVARIWGSQRERLTER